MQAIMFDKMQTSCQVMQGPNCNTRGSWYVQIVEENNQVDVYELLRKKFNFNPRYSWYNKLSVRLLKSKTKIDPYLSKN